MDGVSTDLGVSKDDFSTEGKKRSRFGSNSTQVGDDSQRIISHPSGGNLSKEVKVLENRSRAVGLEDNFSKPMQTGVGEINVEGGSKVKDGTLDRPTRSLQGSEKYAMGDYLKAHFLSDVANINLNDEEEVKVLKEHISTLVVLEASALLESVPEDCLDKLPKILENVYKFLIRDDVGAVLGNYDFAKDKNDITVGEALDQNGLNITITTNLDDALVQVNTLKELFESRQRSDFSGEVKYLGGGIKNTVIKCDGKALKAFKHCEYEPEGGSGEQETKKIFHGMTNMALRTSLVSPHFATRNIASRESSKQLITDGIPLKMTEFGLAMSKNEISCAEGKIPANSSMLTMSEAIGKECAKLFLDVGVSEIGSALTRDHQKVLTNPKFLLALHSTHNLDEVNGEVDRHERNFIWNGNNEEMTLIDCDASWFKGLDAYSASAKPDFKWTSVYSRAKPPLFISKEQHEANKQLLEKWDSDFAPKIAKKYVTMEEANFAKQRLNRLVDRGNELASNNLLIPQEKLAVGMSQAAEKLVFKINDNAEKENDEVLDSDCFEKELMEALVLNDSQRTFLKEKMTEVPLKTEIEKFSLSQPTNDLYVSNLFSSAEKEADPSKESKTEHRTQYSSYISRLFSNISCAVNERRSETSTLMDKTKKLAK